MQNLFFKNTRKKGQWAESLAIEFLEKKGLKLIEKNFSCKMGEIDIIMLDKQPGKEEYLVFIEVRYRKDKDYGHPLETISHYKKQKIFKAAQYFLLKQPQLVDLPCRFDAVAIDSQTDGGNAIEWVPNALEMPA